MGRLINTGDGVLNQDCGADFVKVGQKAPVGLELMGGQRYASIDGDADRLIYYTTNGSFCLLDGDKMASLIAYYIVKKLGKETKLNVGVVQTAYANGASKTCITSPSTSTLASTSRQMVTARSYSATRRA